jgi:hypothetical protein
MADCKPTERHEEIQFRQLLEKAVTKPGTLMKAYSMFWNYSLYVKKGQKAIELRMPVMCKRTVTEQGTDGNEAETEITFKRFVFRRNWFMLSQTDGAEYQSPRFRHGTEPAQCPH